MKASGWTLVTAPVVEPVDVESMKEHLRVSDDTEDLLISEYITAARSWAEEYTGRAFVTQTWDVYFAGWPCDGRGFEIPLPPLQSVTSIKYTPESGAQATLSATVYQLVTAWEPGRVILAYNQAWPTAALNTGLPIVVRVVCGYGLAAAVPAGIKQGLRWLAGHMMENREAVTMANVPPVKVPMSAQWALDPYRFHYIW